MTDIRDGIAAYAARQQGGGDSHHMVSWIQIVIVAIAYIGSLGVFYGTMQSGQGELQRSLDKLSAEVSDMSKSINRLANTNERLDEHMKSVDRRLDVLEKDSAVKEFHR